MMLYVYVFTSLELVLVTVITMGFVPIVKPLPVGALIFHLLWFVASRVGVLSVSAVPSEFCPETEMLTSSELEVM